MRKVGLVFLCVVVIGLVVGYLLAGRRQGTDAEQIAAMIERGRQGIEHKSLDMAMSCISKSYNDAVGFNYDRVRMTAVQAFRDAASFQVTVDSPRITVSGDHAEAATHVTLTPVNSEVIMVPFSGDVTLHLQRERVRRYLIFPAREWKVIRMEGVEEVEGG